MNRWKDWLAQAERDLSHARHALEDGDFDWAAFASQQAAEKAVKALILARGGEPWGHSVTRLLDAAVQEVGVPAETSDSARRLDKHYIPARYPNGFDQGFPSEMYTRGEAEAAIADAEHVIEFCRRHIP
jgi:HEPN domain-containing protein